MACTPSRTTTAVVHTGEHRTSTFRSHSATDPCRHRLLIGQANAEPRMNARVRCPHDTACPCPGLTLCVHMCRCRRAAVRLHPPAPAHAHGVTCRPVGRGFGFQAGDLCFWVELHHISMALPSHPPRPGPAPVPAGWQPAERLHARGGTQCTDRFPVILVRLALGCWRYCRCCRRRAPLWRLAALPHCQQPPGMPPHLPQAPTQARGLRAHTAPVPHAPVC